MDSVRLAICGNAVETLAYGGQLLGVVYFGAHAVLAQEMSLGMLYALLTYRGHFSMHCASGMDKVIGLAALRVHLNRLSDIVCVEPEPLPSIPSTISLPGQIDLNNLGVRFGTHEPWLFRHLSLSVRPGEFVSVIGRSGSGKSTLLRVLAAQMDADEGVVCVNERPLSSPAWQRGYRQACGLVLQGDTLFAASITENVTCTEHFDAQHLEETLAHCGLTDMVRAMPMGLETRVGDAGVNLSAGQIQRLLLARALYRKPRFLFVDEGTANLDLPTSKIVHQVISKHTSTRVVVTHDVALAALADQILVLENGRLTLLPSEQLDQLRGQLSV
jgi:ATP-binding cassette subfamily B protein RaxB